VRLFIETYPDTVTLPSEGEPMAHEPDLTFVFDVNSKGAAVSFLGGDTFD
jgi:hypothetical protein